MGLVLVLRRFDEPRVYEELRAQEDQAAAHFTDNHVTPIRSFFSLDRKHMLCSYEAPDEDAVRRLQQKTALPCERVWSTTMLRKLVGLPAYRDPQGRGTVVCERTYPMPIPPTAVAALSATKRWCLEENNVDLIDSFVPTDNGGSVCIFAAPDAESVRRANRTAQFPFDRIWPATVYAR